MSNEMNSDFLYHYTTIDSLALILKNRTIRLNPLNKLDDLQEQKTADVENLGKFVFVSSWTSDYNESIPMWKMYTNPTSGVRIKLRKNPFAWHNTHGQDIAEKTGMPVIMNSGKDIKLKSFLDLSELLSKGYYSPQAMGGDILKKIEYTNDISLLEPNVLEKPADQVSVHIGKLGIYKNEYWSFQKEWRYIMNFVPIDFMGGPENISHSIAKTANKLSRGIATPPFLYYDLKIDLDAYKDMEITCSPQISNGYRIIVDDLVSKYNATAKICDSDLQGRL